MNPEKKETGDYIAKICKEVVSNYDVDGIHLDYIRYPETWKFNVTKNQGRKYITDIVRKIHTAIKQEKKWVKLTCSPIGKYDNLTRYSSKGWNAKTRVCQDAQEWLRMGIMDGLYPMMYFSGNAQKQQNGMFIYLTLPVILQFIKCLDSTSMMLSSYPDNIRSIK